MVKKCHVESMCQLLLTLIAADMVRTFSYTEPHVIDAALPRSSLWLEKILNPSSGKFTMTFFLSRTSHYLPRLTPLRCLLLATCVACILFVSLNYELSYLWKVTRRPTTSKK